MNFNQTAERLYLIASWFVALWYNKIPISSNNVKNILLIKLDDIGDMVYFTPLFQPLRRTYPNATITLLCKKQIHSLLQYETDIDVIVSSTKHIKTKAFDIIIDGRGSWQTLVWAMLKCNMLWLSKAAVRFKHRGELLHDAVINIKTVQPICTTLSTAIQSNLKVNNTEVLFVDFDVLQPFVVLHLGGNSLLRRWQVNHFAAVVKYIYTQYNMPVAVVGIAAETPISIELQRLCECRIFDLTGELSLAQCGALLAKARLFIGNESGPLHIAAGVGCPTIGLFGPGVPFVFYPKDTHIFHFVLPCNPCNQRVCSQPNDWCMQHISVASVTNCIDILLK